MTSQVTNSTTRVRTLQSVGPLFGLSLLLLLAILYVKLDSFGYALLSIFGVSLLIIFKWTRILVVMLFTAFWTGAVYQALELMGNSLWVSIPVSTLAFIFIYFNMSIPVASAVSAAHDSNHNI